MTRRKRLDSAAFAVEVVDEIKQGPAAWPRAERPPTDTELFAFHAIVESRPFPPWTPAQLICAASAAWLVVQIDHIERELQREGTTLRDARGRAYVNPKVAVLARFRRMSEMSARSLGVDLLSRRGRRADAREFADAARRAQAIRQDLESTARRDTDGLLALPDEVRERLPKKKAKRRKPN